MEVVELMNSINQDATKTLQQCNTNSRKAHTLPEISTADAFPKYRNTVRHYPASPKPHKSSASSKWFTASPETPSPTEKFIAIIDMIRGTKNSMTSEMEHKIDSIKHKYSIKRMLHIEQEESKKAMNTSPKTQFQRMKRLPIISPPTEFRRISSTGSQNSLATAVCSQNDSSTPDHSIEENMKQRLHQTSSESDIIKATLESEHSPHYNSYTDEDEGDSPGIASSTGLIDTSNKYSFTETTPIDTPQDSPIFTLTDPRCYKIHQCHESGPQCMEEDKFFIDNWGHMNSVAPSSLFQRSMSLHDLDEPTPSYMHSLSTGLNSPLDFTHSASDATQFKLVKSDSYDLLSDRKWKSQPNKRVLRDASRTNNSHSSACEKVSPIYQSIPKNGPYERVPMVKLTDIKVFQNAATTKHHSDTPPHTASWSDGKAPHTTIRVGKETSEDNYERIKNSGPYEQVHHMALHDATKNPVPVPSPLPCSTKRINQVLGYFTSATKNKSSIHTGNSMGKDSSHLTSKRYGSVGDLHHIRGTNEDKSAIPTGSCYKPMRKDSSHPTSRRHGSVGDLHRIQDTNVYISERKRQTVNYHHLKVESGSHKMPKEHQKFPQPMPYAMVWFDR